MTARAGAIKTLPPSELILAGHSGHMARIDLNHCSSIARNRRGLEYSTEPNLSMANCQIGINLWFLRC